MRALPLHWFARRTPRATAPEVASDGGGHQNTNQSYQKDHLLTLYLNLRSNSRNWNPTPLTESLHSKNHTGKSPNWIPTSVIQSPWDEGFESSHYALHIGNQDLKKHEGFQNYLAGEDKFDDVDDEFPGNKSWIFPFSFQVFLLLLLLLLDLRVTNWESWWRG